MALQVAVLTLRVMSKVHKTFYKVITTTDRVRSQIMNLCEKMQATPTPGHHFHHYITMPAAYKRKSFDSHSFDVGRVSMASACMSSQKCHFDEYEEIPLGKCDGISGGLRIRGRRTLRIRIKDDNGQIHKISIPNSIHIPGLPMVLISPHHWDQEAGPVESTTMEGKCVIKWGQHLEH